MKKEMHFIGYDGCGSGIEICFGEDFYISEQPVEIEIKESEGIRRVYKSGYDVVETVGTVYKGKAEILTDHGSRILVEDRYQWQENELVFSRKARVLAADGHEEGFATSFGIGAKEKWDLEEYDVFVPGIWYRKNENVVKNAFGSNLADQYFMIRNTRMAMPYIEWYRLDDGGYLALKHLSPAPATGRKEMGAEWMVDDSFRYASMGIRREDGARLVYQFPGSEGEKNYVDGNRAWARRSHPLREGMTQEYSFALFGGRAKGSYEALRSVWRYYYEKETPEHKRADMERVYEDGAEVLNVYCQEYNGVMGIPFWATVPEGTVCDISFQMGFVGQQTMCAYHLMRYGQEHGRKEMIEKAEKIIDFWVEESAKTSVIPRVWYNAFPATFKQDYPTYTRTVADGMEGILACWLYSRRMGWERQKWLDFCITYGDWLASHQNEDGSFYRSYDEKGEPVHKGKFNTTNVIRYLVNLYLATGKEGYKAAAVKAGDYCYEHIYLPMQFVGGTADNDNTIDKEAGMIAVYAFMALYDADGDERWLEAAKGAADFTETWTYVWSYEVKPYKGNGVFDKVDITGLSLIATGHSHADVMMGYMPYEYYRLYLHTADLHYREFALFLNGNTKQTTDWSGKLGHVYRGLVEESGELAMQYHNGLGRWLPWCTIAQIESLTRCEERFGDLDLERIDRMDEAVRKEKNAKKMYSWLNAEEG